MSLSLSAILVVTALRGTLDLSNRVQLGTRAGGTIGRPTLDAETSPDVKVSVQSRRWELTADYAPRFTGSVVGQDPQSYVLHQGQLGARFQARRLSLSLSQDAGHGRLSLLSLGAAPGATLGASPLAGLRANEYMDYSWSRTGIVARLAAARRWGVTLLGDISLSGGASARGPVPFQTRLHAGARVEHAASRRDRVTALVDVTSASFSTGTDNVVVESKVSWRHDLGRGVAATVGGGLGWLTTRGDATPAVVSEALPIVEAGITYRPRTSDLDLGLTLKIAPVIDAFRGQLDERVDATASVAWAPTRELAVQANLGLAHLSPRGAGFYYFLDPGVASSLDPGFASYLGHGAAPDVGSGGLTVSYRVNDVLQLDGGGRGAWIAASGVDSLPQWMVFAGATVRVPTLRF